MLGVSYLETRRCYGVYGVEYRILSVAIVYENLKAGQIGAYNLGLECYASLLKPTRASDAPAERAHLGRDQCD